MLVDCMYGCNFGHSQHMYRSGMRRVSLRSDSVSRLQVRLRCPAPPDSTVTILSHRIKKVFFLRKGQ
jgi:hypothetical protein